MEALLLASSEAVALGLKLSLATKATQLRSDEHARQEEERLLRQDQLARQQARAAATSATVGDLKAKLEADKAAIAALDAQMAALDTADKHAAIKAALIVAGFDADIATTTLLSKVQVRLLSRPAPPPLGTPGVAPIETILNEAFQLANEAEGGQPTRASLLEEMQALVSERASATAACEADVDARRRAFDAAVEEVHQQNKDAVLALDAEKIALDTGMGEREAYLARKQQQLTVEQAEVTATAQLIHGIEQCLKMLSEEVAACLAYQKQCAKVSETASDAKGAAVESLEALRASHAVKQREMRATLASEVQVREQHQAYSTKLQTQLAEMQVVTDGHPLSDSFKWEGEVAQPPESPDIWSVCLPTWNPNHLEPSPSPSRPAPSLRPRSRRRRRPRPLAHAIAHAHPLVLNPPRPQPPSSQGYAPGKASEAMLRENAAANDRWLGELQSRRNAVTNARDELQSKVDAAEKQAATESKRLAEQRAQQVNGG